MPSYNPFARGSAPVGTRRFTTMVEQIKPSSELTPGEHAYQMINSLGLARFDATLRGSADAAAILDSNLVALMAEHGIAVEVWQ